MNVQYRPMQLRDIRKCVEHIAAHPVLGPRYGKLIEHLPRAISCALRYDYVTVNVFEELQGSTVRLLGVGMAVFISDYFLHQAKTAPLFWVGPEMVKRIVSGKSPLLSEAEVRDANSTTGLNLMVWHNTCHPKDLMRTEVAVKTMTAFEETFRGFRLRELFAQADSPEQLQAMRNTGGFYFDRLRGRYGSIPEVDPRDFSNEPRNVGITRESALAHAGSWVGCLFIYDPPKFGFSRGEQRLLNAAQDGETDEELSEKLGISIYAVKMRWRMIYDRAAACLPDLVTDGSRVDGEAHRRGKEKKQRLLDYVRKHPEEVRPVSRKLLRQSGMQRTVLT
jgi:DNA-binding CsgD family transcriptional regulator